MAIKELQTRLALKYDSYANWTDDTKEGLGANLVLLKGELGICAIEDKAQGAQTAPTVLFKVGDGTSPFKSLKWASALAADVYAWAKASDVRLSGKTIEFVGGKDAEGNDIIVKSIAINYATPEEVAAAVKVVSDNLAGVDARVLALENKFTGEGSVDAKIATAKQEAIDAAASDATTKAGTAETNAKAYTDEREVEINKAIAQAKTDANGYTDGKVATINGELTSLDSRLDAIEGEGEGSVKKALADAKAYADQAELDAVATANAYADGLAGNYDAAGAAATAEANANSYTDGKVSILSAEDLRLAGLISDNADAIAAETEAREGAVNTINAKLDVEKVSTAIATAKQEAIDSAATTAQGKVDALANGQVNTNKVAIEALQAADTEIRGLITTETGARETADNLLSGRLDAVEAFFATAEGETLDTALDTLKEIQDYLNGEGEATGGILSRVAQAETDIDNLETRATNLETRAGNLEAADTAIECRLDVIEGSGDGSIAKAVAGAIETAAGDATSKANAAESAAKSHADSVAATAKSEAITAANGYTDGKVATLTAKDSEIEGKVTTLQQLTSGYTGEGAIKTAIDAAASAASVADGKAVAAQGAADAAQGTADAVKAAVEHETTGLAATKVIADRADAKSVDNAGRLDTAESKITTLQGIVETGADSNANLRQAITDLQTLTGTTGAIRTEIAAAQKAGDDAAKAVDDLAKGQVATNKTNIKGLDSRVTAIENDYLKAADVYVFNCGSSTTVTHEAPKAE